MKSADLQMAHVQQMGNSLRAATAKVQAQADESKFFMSGTAGKALRVLGIGAGAVIGVAAVGIATAGAAPLLGVAAGAFAAAVATGSTVLASTAIKRAEMHAEATAFLKQAKSLYTELGVAYNEIRNQQQNSQSNDYSPSADMIAYQRETLAASQAAKVSASTSQTESQSHRSSYSPRL